jgi:hypothetical protein
VRKDAGETVTSEGRWPIRTRRSTGSIASLHLEEEQDWRQLAALYGELARLTGSPVVEFNQAAALAEAGEVETALASSTVSNSTTTSTSTRHPRRRTPLPRTPPRRTHTMSFTPHAQSSTATRSC